MTSLSADIETEIRRLRIRIIGLSSNELDAAGARTAESGAGRATTRRETIAEALAEFSAIGSEGRTVPELGDQSLADQVVVLLEHGMRAAGDASPDDREGMLAQLLEAATRLRRGLA